MVKGGKRERGGKEKGEGEAPFFYPSIVCGHSYVMCMDNAVAPINKRHSVAHARGEPHMHTSVVALRSNAAVLSSRTRLVKENEGEVEGNRWGSEGERLGGFYGTLRAKCIWNRCDTILNMSTCNTTLSYTSQANNTSH